MQVWGARICSAAVVLLGLMGWRVWERSGEVRAAVEILTGKVEGQEGARDVWNAWESGMPIPVLEKTPVGLPGARKIVWTRTHLEVFGLPTDRCGAIGGVGDRKTCRFMNRKPRESLGSALRSDSRMSEAGLWRAGVPERTLGHTTSLIENLGGEVTVRGCKGAGPAHACELRLEVDVPTVNGIGDILWHLSSIPFVMERLEWEGGRLDLRGSVLNIRKEER